MFTFEELKNLEFVKVHLRTEFYDKRCGQLGRFKDRVVRDERKRLW